MKKYLVVCLMIMLFMTGCTPEKIDISGTMSDLQEENQVINENVQSSVGEIEPEITANAESSTGVSENLMKQEENHEYELDLTKIGNWVPYLKRNGQLTVDVNGDGVNDQFRIDYVIKEGSSYIALFEFILGDGERFVISESDLPYEDYDAELEVIELLDFNGDGAEELILMFDTHGAGGCGTHEIFVLWMDEDNHIVGQSLNGQVALSEHNQIQTSEETNFDMIYRIQKIRYEGKERLMTYQNMWEGTHSNGTGDLICIVTLEKHGETFEAERAWLALEQPMW